MMHVKHILLKETPLVRIYLIFTIGTSLGLLYPKHHLGLISILLVALIVSFALFIRAGYKSSKLIKQSRVVAYLLMSSLIPLSYGLASLDFQRKQNLSQQFQVNKETILALKILNSPSEKANSYQAIARINSKLTKEKSLKKSAKVLLYFEKKPQFKELPSGTEFVAKLKLGKPPPAANPNQFSYADYLAAQGIFYTAFVDSIIHIKTKEPLHLRAYNIYVSFQQDLQNMLLEFIPDLEQRAVINALLLGNKQELNTETKMVYARSGAMHVLAVSGLHVGIIYLILSQLLFFLKSRSSLKSILLILGIWIYAVLTGASPSVLRASSMFTFIAIGNVYKQHINIYNVLAASALMLTIFSPSIILNVGFQLSYSAVIGILYFQKRIYQLVSPSNFFIDKVWLLSSVSIAAQLGTLPLSLYYFHQFPAYFWLSNLLVIPAASLIVYLGIALFIVPIHMAKVWIGKILNALVTFLNSFLVWLSELPFALSEGWHLSKLEVALAYLLIISLSMTVSLRHKKLLFSSTLLILMISISFSWKKIIHSGYDEFIVYSTKNYSLLSFKSGLNVHFFTSAKPNVRKELAYTYKNMLIANQIQEHKIHGISRGFKLYNFKQHSFLLLNGRMENMKDILVVDFAIISNQKDLDLSEMASHVNAGMYIFDGTNNYYLYNAWKKACKDSDLNCYFVQDSTAYVRKL